MNYINGVIVLTVTVLGILIVKKIFERQITPRGHMLMWYLVGILIVTVPLADMLPVMPEADWSLRRYLPQVTETYTYTAQRPSGPSGQLEPQEEFSIETVRKQLGTGVVITKETGSSLEYFRKLNRTVGIVWATGTGIAAGLFLLAAYRQRRKLKKLQDCTNAGILHIFHRVCTELELHCKIRLKTGSDATMLAGLQRPAVYLKGNGEQFTETELHHVFAHELTHYKHGDLWLTVSAAGLLCVFWWNPIFWLAFCRFRFDMELYCDYDAARMSGDRQAYARTLVKAASRQKGLTVMTTSLAEAEHQVSRRVKALAKFRQPKVWVSVLAVAVLLGMGAGLVMKPGEVQPQITREDAEFLRLDLQNSQGGKVVLYLDEQKESFLSAVNGDWREANIWRDVDINKGDARNVVHAYLENLAEPAASFQFHSFSEMVSSHYPNARGSSVKLYSWGDSSRGFMVLEHDGKAVYISDSEELWSRLVKIVGEMTVMRDVIFDKSSEEVNWIDEEGVLHRKAFSREDAAESLEDYLFHLPAAERKPLSNAETEACLKENRFDYWLDLGPMEGGHKIIGHLSEEPVGQGKTVVIGVEVGSSYIYDDPELAKLLEQTIKMELLPEETDLHVGEKI